MLNCQPKLSMPRLCCQTENTEHQFELVHSRAISVIATQGYERQFGDKSALDIVLDHVLRLTYTATTWLASQRTSGYDGPPFIWDEEERRHQRARLDALYFHLYGISGRTQTIS